MGNRVELGLQKNLSKALFIGFNCQVNSILFDKKKMIRLEICDIRSRIPRYNILFGFDSNQLSKVCLPINAA